MNVRKPSIDELRRQVEEELEGEWVPGKDLEGPLNATLGTRGAFLYDWIPLVSGWNAGIYGILDAEIRLTGSARDVHAEGRCRLSELHRWEQLPLSEAAAVSIYLRGEFDRNRGRALLESLEVSFVDSRLHANGAIEGIPSAPVFDLVVALERSRLEDLLVISRSLGTRRTGFGLAGRVDGFLSVQGPWDQRRYGGFFTARQVRLSTPSGTFPVSEVAVRIQEGAARLAPARIALSPRVDLVAEGTLAGIGFDPSTRRFPGPPRYDLELSSRAVPVHDIVGFAAALGSRLAQNIDAEGVESSVFHLTGIAWPPTGPSLNGRGEIHAARLLLPGLTEPLNLPSAQVEVHDDLITVDHLVAVLGTSVFSGKLRHRGDRKRPWDFELHANALSLEQGSLWFEALGRRKSLLERMSGLDSSASRRLAASSLFTALDARGQFSTPVLTYRALVFKDFRAAVEIADRVVRVTDATFQGAGGRGHGSARVDLTNAPAALSADVTLADASLTSVAHWLPPALRRVSGSCALSGHFAARGITREEIGPSLEGQMTLGLKNVNLGGFDPLEAFARHAGWGSLLDPGRGEVTFRSAEATLHIRDRQVILEPSTAETAGVQFNFAGTYAFAGDIALNVGADFRRLRRRLVNGGALGDPAALVGNFLLSGRADRLELTPGLQVSRAIQ